MKRSYLLILGLIAFIFHGHVYAYVFDPAGNQACFYDQTNYQGVEYCYAVGDYAEIDTSMRNLFRSVPQVSYIEKASSIKFGVILSQSQIQKAIRSI